MRTGYNCGSKTKEPKYKYKLDGIETGGTIYDREGKTIYRVEVPKNVEISVSCSCGSKLSATGSVEFVSEQIATFYAIHYYCVNCERENDEEENGLNNHIPELEAESYQYHCIFEFGSKECGYSGPETNCDKTSSRCVELNNFSRFVSSKNKYGYYQRSMPCSCADETFLERVLDAVNYLKLFNRWPK